MNADIVRERERERVLGKSTLKKLLPCLFFRIHFNDFYRKKMLINGRAFICNFFFKSWNIQRVSTYVILKVCFRWSVSWYVWYDLQTTVYNPVTWLSRTVDWPQNGAKLIVSLVMILLTNQSELCTVYWLLWLQGK